MTKTRPAFCLTKTLTDHFSCNFFISTYVPLFKVINKRERMIETENRSMHRFIKVQQFQEWGSVSIIRAFFSASFLLSSMTFDCQLLTWFRHTHTLTVTHSVTGKHKAQIVPHHLQIRFKHIRFSTFVIVFDRHSPT